MTQTQTTCQDVSDICNSLFKAVDNVQKYIEAQNEKVDSIVKMDNDVSESIRKMLSNWHGMDIEAIILFNEGFRTIAIIMDKNHELYKAYFGRVLNSREKRWIYNVDKNHVDIHVLRRTIRHCRKVADHWNRAIVQIGV